MDGKSNIQLDPKAHVIFIYSFTKIFDSQMAPSWYFGIHTIVTCRKQIDCCHPSILLMNVKNEILLTMAMTFVLTHFAFSMSLSITMHGMTRKI